MGNCAHTCAQIQIAWTVVSDERDKCVFGQVPHGRGFLQKINPVKFAFKDRNTGCLTDPEEKRRYGFSAQEMLAAEGDNPVITSTEDPNKLQVTSDYLVPVLVNAIKELSTELDTLHADLTNVYEVDADYAPGTVVVFGGDKEITIAQQPGDPRVAGVISENSSGLMNNELTADHRATVALTGRVPTLVHGPVIKGDMMISAGNGYARACATPAIGTVIGKALENFNGENGKIEIAVGRM
jgi:hypothetical protein